MSPNTTPRAASAKGPSCLPCVFRRCGPAFARPISWVPSSIGPNYILLVLDSPRGPVSSYPAQEQERQRATLTGLDPHAMLGAYVPHCVSRTRGEREIGP